MTHESQVNLYFQSYYCKADLTLNSVKQVGTNKSVSCTEKKAEAGS